MDHISDILIESNGLVGLGKARIPEFGTLVDVEDFGLELFDEHGSELVWILTVVPLD